MATENGEGTVSKAAPSRVAQLGARLKAVAPTLPNLPTLPTLPTLIKTDKNVAKKNVAQKRPAPVLPSEARLAADQPQELNAYIKAMAKGEPTSYSDILRVIGELKAQGEKGQKTLLLVFLPRLAQHELPPASLLPQLLQLASGSDDRRLLRFVYYLVQLIVSSGSAGTPSIHQGDSAQSFASLPQDVVAKVWADVLAPETPAALTDLQLRSLAAATRASEGSQLEKQLAAAVGAVLDRAETIISLGPVKEKAQRRQLLEAWDLHYTSILATRSSLQGKTGNKIALRCSTGIVSPNPTGARHALGLLRTAMTENAAGVFKADKDLAGLMRSTVAAYMTSAYNQAADGKAPQEARRTVNLSEKWARLEIARVCAAAVYADWTSTSDFVGGVGAPFWDFLALMATRDVENLVVLEAIRLIFGGTSSASLPPGPAASAADAKNIKLRVRAWLFVSLNGDKPVSSADGVPVSETDSLCHLIGVRLQQMLRSSSPEPLLCSACRTAGTILETAARASGRGARTSKESKHLQAFVQDVAGMVSAIQASSKSSAVQHAALDALLWTQVGNKEASVSAAALRQQLRGSLWHGSWVTSLLETVFQVMRAAPTSAPHLLDLAGAVASAAAASIQPEQLTDLWSMAMRLPNGKPAALSSALNLLACPRSSTSIAKGASSKQLARAAADDAGYLELQRNAAWWLGENANLACNEFAGSLAPTEEINENEAPAGTTTPLETAALEALRNPALAAVISHLQHAALTQPPAPRTAAVQAITKIAVRSEEPYRLQCYSFLATLSNTHRASEPDTHGVACIVQPVLPILDSLYSSRLVLEGLAQRYGRIPQTWPPAVVAQLRQRHNLLEQRIQRVICSLASASYFILGPLSRDLLNSGVESLVRQELPSLQKIQAKQYASSDSSSDASQPQSQHLRQASFSSRKQSMSEPSFLAGPDPLAALTDNLNQHITAEAFKPRGPQPWETNAFQPPITIAEEPEEPEEPAFDQADPLGDMLNGTRSQDYSQEAEERSQPVVPTMSERGRVIHTFEAEMSDELTVRTGEQVEVQAEVDGWLHCENQYGIKGLVPATYIRIISDEEGPADPLAQLFGGYSQPSHQREKSVDLLNQPDMLSAFLSPAPAADDWGSQTYHARTASRTYDFEEPAYLADEVEGGMAVPEPQPYTEPPHLQQYDSYGSLAQDNQQDEFVENGHDYESAVPEAADNPFLGANDNPFTDDASPLYHAAPPTQGFAQAATIAPQQSISFESQASVQEPLVGDRQPAVSTQPSVLFESQPSVAYEQPPAPSGEVQVEFESGRPSLEQPTARAPSMLYESSLPPVLEADQSISQAAGFRAQATTIERSSTLAKREELPSIDTAGLARRRLEGATSTSLHEPTSARIEHGSDISESPMKDVFRSGDLYGVASPALSTPPTQEGLTPSAASIEHRRTHSRAMSRDMGSLSRKFSMSEVAAHRRRASRASFDLGSPISRQASVDTGLTSIKGQVLYGFTGESEDELSVSPGEQIIIQAEMEGWFQVMRLSDGRRGLIPASYAKMS